MIMGFFDLFRKKKKEELEPTPEPAKEEPAKEEPAKEEPAKEK